MVQSVHSITKKGGLFTNETYGWIFIFLVFAVKTLFYNKTYTFIEIFSEHNDKVRCVWEVWKKETSGCAYWSFDLLWLPSK